MTSWEVAQRLRNISKLAPFAPSNLGVLRLRYLDASTLFMSLDLDDVGDELVEYLARSHQIDSGIADAVTGILKSNISPLEDNLRNTIPKGIRYLSEIDSLQPSTIRKLFFDLSIETPDELERAIRSGRIERTTGFGTRFASQLDRILTLHQKGRKALVLLRAMYLSKTVKRVIDSIDEVKSSIIVGDIRRGKEIIDTVEILCEIDSPNRMVTESLASRFAFDKTSITKSGFECVFDGLILKVHFCSSKFFGSAKVFFTGPSNHIDGLSRLIKRARKLPPGFFAISGSEEEFYAKLGLTHIPPEVREWDDAIELAKSGFKWGLIEKEDILGDLHVHTNWSDGRSNLKELVQTASRIGYDYLAITDHANKLSVANGISMESLVKQIANIRKRNAEHTDFEVIPGIEYNIDNSGMIDYSIRERIFKIGAIHTGISQTKEEITERYVNAITNTNINVLGHITSRKLFVRDGYDLDWEPIFDKCAKRNVAVELNYAPDRMDLPWEIARIADKCGCMFALGGDIHYSMQLFNVDLGVLISRRAGLSKEKMLNCHESKIVREWTRSRV